MKMCCHKEKRGGTRCPKKIVNGSVGNPCSFCLTVQSSVQFLTYSVNDLFLMLKFQIFFHATEKYRKQSLFLCSEFETKFKFFVT